MSPKELESQHYTHCWLLSRLHRGKKKKTDLVSMAPSLQNILVGIFNIIANEDPTWLYYSYTTYRLHLSQASV